MKISTLCSNCGKSFKVNSDYVGRKGKCPACQTTFTIEAIPETPVAAAEASSHAFGDFDANVTAGDEALGAESDLASTPDYDATKPMSFESLTFGGDATHKKTERLKTPATGRMNIGIIVATLLVALIPGVAIFVESRERMKFVNNQLAELTNRLKALETTHTDTKTSETKPDANVSPSKEKLADVQPEIVHVEDDTQNSERVERMRKASLEAELILNSKREQLNEARKQVEIEQKRVEDAFIGLGLRTPGERMILQIADQKAQLRNERFDEREISAALNFHGPVAEAIRKQLVADVDALVKNAKKTGEKFTGRDVELCSMARVPMPDAMRQQFKKLGEESGIRVRMTELEESKKRVEELEREIAGK